MDKDTRVQTEGVPWWGEEGVISYSRKWLLCLEQERNLREQQRPGPGPEPNYNRPRALTPFVGPLAGSLCTLPMFPAQAGSCLNPELSELCSFSAWSNPDSLCCRSCWSSLHSPVVGPRKPETPTPAPGPHPSTGSLFEKPQVILIDKLHLPRFLPLVPQAYGERAPVLPDW